MTLGQFSDRLKLKLHSYYNVNVSVKNIYRRRHIMSRIRIGGAGGRIKYWVVCSSKQFCFQMCLECGDGGGTFSR